MMTMPLEHTSIAGTIHNLFARTYAALTMSHHERADRAVLRNISTLPDYLLADIGLERHDVEMALLTPHLEDATVVLMRARRNPLKDGRTI